jgi:pimeloyl-ACP methyl ester carboxylesterase
MTVLTRPGGDVSYETRGSGSPPLLLSHGYGATSAMFAQDAAVLSAGNQVITWDLPGHGASDSPADPAFYGAAAVLDDMTAILDVLGHDRAVLGGHSLGGYLSLSFALSHPDRVAGLMLIGTGPGFRNEAARDDWNRRAHATAKRLEEQGLGALGGSAELHAGQHRDVSGLALAARHLLTQHDSRVIDGLPGITVPALIVVGAEDTQFLGAADYMAAKIPRARKVVIDGAGHAPNVARPAEFDAQARLFLAEVAADQADQADRADQADQARA